MMSKTAILEQRSPSLREYDLSMIEEAKHRTEDALRDVEDAQRDLLDWLEDWKWRMEHRGEEVR